MLQFNWYFCILYWIISGVLVSFVMVDLPSCVVFIINTVLDSFFKMFDVPYYILVITVSVKVTRYIRFDRFTVTRRSKQIDQ